MDKVLLFKAKKFNMPEGLVPLPPLNEIENVRSFQALLAEEMPYFLWWVDQYDVPEDIKAERFGLKAYKNPELMRELELIGQGNEVHYVVQTALFGHRLSSSRLEHDENGAVEVEINELYDMLLGDPPSLDRVKSLFRNARTLGNALARVGPHGKKFYRRRKSHGHVWWTVKPDETVPGVTETRGESPESPLSHPHKRQHRPCENAFG
jgi:hypothetical protein